MVTLPLVTLRMLNPTVGIISSENCPDYIGDDERGWCEFISRGKSPPALQEPIEGVCVHDKKVVVIDSTRNRVPLRHACASV